MNDPELNVPDNIVLIDFFQGPHESIKKKQITNHKYFASGIGAKGPIRA